MRTKPFVLTCALLAAASGALAQGIPQPSPDGEAVRFDADAVQAGSIPLVARPLDLDQISDPICKSSEMFAHGLNERVPVKGFYDGLDHAYRLGST